MTDYFSAMIGAGVIGFVAGIMFMAVLFSKRIGKLEKKEGLT